MRPDGTASRPHPLLTLGEQWLAAWRLGAALGWEGAASLAKLSDPHRLRKAWSTNLTETIDRTLRSPEFLRLMACQLRAMADATRFTSTLLER